LSITVRTPFWRALAILLASCAALAQTPPVPSAGYEPVAGQPGKDVVWIPTPDHAVEKMLDMAEVTPADFVIDLGSGDGRNVIAAARRGARALGVEYNPDLVALSRRNAQAAGVADKATFEHGDMFAADISRASVLMLFLLPSNLEKLAPRFLQLKPGARIVSNTYEIGGGWEPDDVQQAQPCKSWCSLVKYVIPAKVAGTWRLGDDEWLTLEQSFQKVFGTYQINNVSVPISDGRLRGEELRFAVNKAIYTARVNGDNLSGTALGSAVRTWQAVRIGE